MDTEEHQNRYGGPYVQVHRADLQQSLLKVAEHNGVKVHRKSRIVDYDFDTPAMVTHDGSRIEKDLILAADGKLYLFPYEEGKDTETFLGIKSIAHQKLSNLAEGGSISMDLAVLRATLDVAIVSKDPELAHLSQEPGINLW